jgi:hypothetical protein
VKKIIRDFYLEVFSYPTEDDSKVFEAVYNILGFKADLAADRIESYYGPSIIKYYFHTDKQSQIKKIMGHLLKKISKNHKKEITNDLKDRIDARGNLYIRLDKQEALLNKILLCYHGDVIKIRMGFTSYPFSVNKVLNLVRDVFEHGKL